MASGAATTRVRGLLVGLGVVVVQGLLGACASGGTSAGDYVGNDAVASVAEELQEEGRAGYYLGPEANGLALTNVDRVTENGPDFQFWASYGRCEVGMFEDGGCADPPERQHPCMAGRCHRHHVSAARAAAGRPCRQRQRGAEPSSRGTSS